MSQRGRQYIPIPVHLYTCQNGYHLSESPAAGMVAGPRLASPRQQEPGLGRSRQEQVIPQRGTPNWAKMAGECVARPQECWGLVVSQWGIHDVYGSECGVLTPSICPANASAIESTLTRVYLHITIYCSVYHTAPHVDSSRYTSFLGISI